MPPLIIYVIGFVAVLLYFLLPVWLAIPVVITLVLVALFRFRHLGRLRQQFPPKNRDDSPAPLWDVNTGENSAARPVDESTPHHSIQHHSHSPPDGGSGHASHQHDASPSVGADCGGGHHGP